MRVKTDAGWYTTAVSVEALKKWRDSIPRMPLDGEGNDEHRPKLAPRTYPLNAMVVRSVGKKDACHARSHEGDG